MYLVSLKSTESSAVVCVLCCEQVDETCPKCNNRGMEFYTMQLRSADEGQTVFYECPKCM